MKFVSFVLLTICLTIYLAVSLEFDEDHDESIHDEEEGDSSVANEEVKSHLKDIIRGFSDKGFEECDQNKDDYLDESEIECFVSEKMGFAIKTTPEYVVHHYDQDQNDKLDKNEVWNIVENKDPAIFKMLESTIQRNMLLMQGIQEEHLGSSEFTDDGLEIRY